MIFLQTNFSDLLDLLGKPRPVASALHPLLFPGHEDASPETLPACRQCGGGLPCLHSRDASLEAFGVAVTTALPHTAPLQELRSDLRFLCPFCVHRKYTALQAAPARSPITGPLYFPLDFSQTRTETETPADPLSQSPAASPAAPGRPGDVVHQRGRPRVSNSTEYSPWRPSRRKHNPKSRRTRRRLRRKAREHDAHQLLTLAALLRTSPADDPQVHAAAIDLADWVESEQLPEESLESQVAWCVLEHCSGTPGPLDLPTLAAFLDIATGVYQPSPAG